MKFELPKLPYAMNALEPVISAKTMEYHYGKHHQAYVNNLNNLILGTEFENATLDEIVMKAEGGIFNNAAQVWNHTFFWNCMTPAGGNGPLANLKNAIEKQYGSIEAFKKEFSAKALSLFGSGWTWLVKTADGKLDIVQEGNAGNPMRKGLKPLLTLDVWEHAYYLDHQNRRADFIDMFWNIVDWEAVEARF